MSLATEKFVAPPEEQKTVLEDENWTSWYPISRGLRMVVAGYRVLVAGAIISPPLLWLGVHEGPWTDWLEKHDRHPHTLLFLGLIILGLTAFFSYGWVLRGYVMCLVNTRGRLAARLLVAAALLCVIATLVLTVVGLIMDHGATYAALQQREVKDVLRLDRWSDGLLLVFGAAMLGLVNSLAFCLFLHVVGGCFNDRVRIRRVDLNFVFVGVMLGGSIGTLYCMRLWLPRMDLFPWLAGGWASCFAWHLWLVNNMRQGVEDGADREYLRREAIAGVHSPSVLSAVPKPTVSVSVDTPVSWEQLKKVFNEQPPVDTSAADDPNLRTDPPPPIGLRGIRPISGLYKRPSKLTKTVKPEQK